MRDEVSPLSCERLSPRWWQVQEGREEFFSPGNQPW